MIVSFLTTTKGSIEQNDGSKLTCLYGPLNLPSGLSAGLSALSTSNVL